MAKCSPPSAHKWVLTMMGSKTYVHCQMCGTRFPFTNELSGAPYKGKVPEKYA